MHDSQHNTTQRNYQIHIKDLELQSSIGILPHEKQTKQTVLITLLCEVSAASATAYVCYDHLIRRIESFFAQGHIELIEEAVESIAQICLFANAQIQSIQVRVDKKDIYAHVQRVGVQITRTRADFPAPPSSL